MVNSQRKAYRYEDMPIGITIRHAEMDRAEFSTQAAQDFLYEKFCIVGKQLICDLIEYYTKYIIFSDERIYTLLAVWTLGTYTYSIFRVFPYIALRSATKQCGKSRTLDVMSLICFNADPRLTSPTEASLFRNIDKNGGTILLDEIEGLKNDKDRLSSVLAVLNTGFEQGGYVSRMERRGNKFVEIKYESYAPKALAGINKLADTLESSAIIIYLKRKRVDEPVQRFSRIRLQREVQPLKDHIYIWALQNAGKLADIYNHTVSSFKGLDPLGDRDRDLWEPLVSIALALHSGCVTDNQVLNNLISLSGDFGDIKIETEEESVMRLVGKLEACLGDRNSIHITPTELRQFLLDNGTIIGSEKALAQRLAPLGLNSKSTWNSDTKKSMRAYELTREVLEDLKARFTRHSPVSNCAKTVDKCDA